MNIHDLYDQRKNFFLTLSSTIRGGLVFCLIVGAISFAYAMISDQQTRAWGSFLFNLFFFFSLALGGVVFAAMQDALGAVWGRPIKRIHESFASFLPVAACLFLGFFVCIALNLGGADRVFSWIHDPSIVDHFWGKNMWLVENFMLARDIVALAIIVALARWQLKTVLERDMIFLAGERDKSLEVGLAAKNKLRYWSSPILVVYALTFTVLAFDITMSLSPLWFSTLWGGWSFSIMMQTLFATTLLFMFALKGTPLGQVIKRQQFHDLGKLMHGFTIFFAYLTYAHVLTYWYGNVPEETEYFLHRLHGPWLYIVLIAPIFNFVVPLFALLPKISKWTAPLTVPICLMILVAQWFTYLLVVMPEVVDATKWSFPIIEFGVFLGFLGMFLLTVFAFGKKYPMLGLADPLLPKAITAEH